MNSQGFSGGLQVVFMWITRLVYLNVLWVLFSLLGLVVLGVGPATASVFAILRNWLLKGEDFSIWHTFKDNYTAMFVSANKLMLVIIPVCLFLAADFAVIRTLPESVLIDKFVFPAIIVMTVFTIVTIHYTFASFVHFEITFWQYFKYAALIAGVFPLQTFLSVFGLALFFVIAFVYPAVVPFFGISVPATIIQFCFIKSVGNMNGPNKREK